MYRCCESSGREWNKLFNLLKTEVQSNCGKIRKVCGAGDDEKKTEVDGPLSWWLPAWSLRNINVTSIGNWNQSFLWSYYSLWRPRRSPCWLGKIPPWSSQILLNRINYWIHFDCQNIIQSKFHINLQKSQSSKETSMKSDIEKIRYVNLDTYPKFLKGIGKGPLFRMFFIQKFDHTKISFSVGHQLTVSL